MVDFRILIHFQVRENLFLQEILALFSCCIKFSLERKHENIGKQGSAMNGTIEKHASLPWPTSGGHQRNAFWQLKTSVVCVQVRLAKENSVSSNADPSRPDRAGHYPRVGFL